MKYAGKVALCGLSTALAAGCMLLSAIPATEYAVPVIAGLLLLPVILEVGPKAGWAVYAASAVLTLLLAPLWEPKLLFVLFFGYYPVVKCYADRLNRPLGWLLKFGIFNVAMVATYLLLQLMSGLPSDAFVLFGVSVPLVFLLVGNLLLPLYDRAINVVIRFYCVRLQRSMRRIFK